MKRWDPDMPKAAPAERVRATTAPAIQLRHLRYFLMVSEELHFGRAAERLHMAQPPLSQAIRRLEEELGVQLLARTSRGTALTEAGRVFAEHAGKVLAGLDLAVAETRRASGGSASLQIGYSPYLPIGRLIHFLDGLHEQEPRLRPQVSHLVALEQIRRLQRNELDLGIFPSGGTLPKLETQPLFPGEPLVAFLTADHPLAEQPVIGPDDVTGETLVSFWQAGHPPLAAWLREQMEGAGYRFRALHESGTDTRDWVVAVAEGRGLALLPSSASPTAEVGGLVVSRPLEPPLTMPDTVVAWRTRPPAQLRALTNTIRALARTLHETTASGDRPSGNSGGRRLPSADA